MTSVVQLTEAFLNSVDNEPCPALAVWGYAALVNTIVGYDYGTSAFPIHKRIISTRLAADSLSDVVKLGMSCNLSGLGLIKHHLLLAIVHVPFHLLDPIFVKEVLAFVGDESSYGVRWLAAWHKEAQEYLAVYDRYAEEVIKERAADLDEANAELEELEDEEDYYDSYRELVEELDFAAIRKAYNVR